MCSRVEHQERQFKLCGELDLLNKRFQRDFTVIRRGRRKVDEVTGVAENASEFGLGELTLIGGEILRTRWFPKPLHIVLHEDLTDLASNVASALESQVNSSCSR